jgi:hypothetical protein
VAAAAEENAAPREAALIRICKPAEAPSPWFGTKNRIGRAGALPLTR